MKPVSAFECFCWTTFSNPTEDRLIYKLIRKFKFRSIVEVGLGSGTRAEKMIRVAKKYGASNGVRYTGIDCFESRKTDQPQLSLRQMHKRLSASDAKIQLVPGELNNSLVRIANSHVRTDLILISAGQNEDTLAECWYYIPRMLHAGSKFLIQREEGEAFETLSRLQIEKLVDDYTVKRPAKAA